MKKIFSIMLSLFLYTNVSFANDKLAFIFNIIPYSDSKKNSVIDLKVQKKLNFRLYENQGPIYFNDKKIAVNDKKFEIDTTYLEEIKEIKFTNAQNEEVVFKYYVSDKDGLVKDYLIESKQAYIKTVENVKILFTSKDSSKINLLTKLLKNIPDKMKANLRKIILFPSTHSSGAAGAANFNIIKLYNLSSYSNKQIKRIIAHEVAHTWAHELRKNKIIDYSYTNFEKAVRTDKKFVTKYGQKTLSEDFADSVSLYLYDTKYFVKNFPARAFYIYNLIVDI